LISGLNDFATIYTLNEGFTLKWLKEMWGNAAF